MVYTQQDAHRLVLNQLLMQTIVTLMVAIQFHLLTQVCSLNSIMFHFMLLKWKLKNKLNFLHEQR